MRWTQREVAQLKLLCKTKTVAEIAAVFKTLPGVVKREMRKHRLIPRPPKPKTFKEIAVIANHCERHGVEATAKNFHLRQAEVQKFVDSFNKQVTTYARTLSPDEVNLIRMRARRTASVKGKPEYGDDFASYAVFKKMTLQYEKLNYDYLWMNFAQSTFGDWGTGCGQVKVRANTNYVEIANGEFYTEDKKPPIQIAGEDLRVEKVDFGVFSNQLKLRENDRIFFILYFKWGFNYAEIAELFGVTESRISQRFSPIFAKVKTHLNV